MQQHPTREKDPLRSRANVTRADPKQHVVRRVGWASLGSERPDLDRAIQSNWAKSVIMEQHRRGWDAALAGLYGTRETGARGIIRAVRSG
jgi:hypothetical protein